jgi:proton-translocating NADH-quinone oxidoreductase chain M
VYSSLILLPFLSVIALNIMPRKAMKKIIFVLGLVLLVFQVYLTVCHSTYCWNCQLYIFSNLFKFNLGIDAISRAMLLSISIILFAVFLVAAKTVKGSDERFNFFNLLLLMLAGLNGIVMVRDIFSLYVFLEIVAVTSFILIAFNGELDSLESAYKYIILSAVATVLMITSIALLVLVAGGTEFSSLRSALSASPDKNIVLAALGIFLCGLFIKAGLIPFHGWLPDAYAESPAAVSVLLAGIVTKIGGVYTLLRLVEAVFGFSSPVKNILMLTGTVSIILGALMSLGQVDMKRMLAYSSISQVGYIVLGFGCGTPLGIAGAVFHFFNHAIFKSLLFVNAAAVESQTGSRDMSKMAGLAQRMPVTGITSVLASLSAAGIPPLAGFWSKLLIVMALWSAGYFGYAVIAVLASVLTLGYFLNMQRNVFFGKPAQDSINVREAGFELSFPAVMLGAIIVAAGVLFGYLMNTYLVPIQGIFGG